MSSKAKKIYLLLTIVVPFIAYCFFYYRPIISNAPFRSDEFVSFQYKWGAGNDLPNSYDSKTGDFQYLNAKDSLVIKSKARLINILEDLARGQPEFYSNQDLRSSTPLQSLPVLAEKLISKIYNDNLISL